MSLGLNILLIFVFLLLGSVFAGTELALVSLRGSQIDQMEQEDARGKRVAKIARDPNTFLSTVQIGVTLSGFLSASFGESSISPFIVPVVEGWGVPNNVAAPLTTIVLTLVISYCSIVISEMVPKRIAMQRNEQIARAVVPAISAFAKVCRPIIWLIGKNTNGIVRLLGFDPNETESEVSDEELRVLVSSNTNLTKDERTILDDVFDASETIVAEVMRPRADVVFLDGDTPLADAAAQARAAVLALPGDWQVVRRRARIRACARPARRSRPGCEDGGRCHARGHFTAGHVETATEPVAAAQTRHSSGCGD